MKKRFFLVFIMTLSFFLYSNNGLSEVAFNADSVNGGGLTFPIQPPL